MVANIKNMGSVSPLKIPNLHKLMPFLALRRQNEKIKNHSTEGEWTSASSISVLC